MSAFPSQAHGRVMVIEVEGRLDALAAPRLEETLKQATGSGQACLLVDLGRVTYISSSCLRLLLVGARQTRERGGDLKLCCLSPRVRQIFSLAGFDLVFELWDSRDQALAAFDRPAGGPGQPCPGG